MARMAVWRWLTISMLGMIGGVLLTVAAATYVGGWSATQYQLSVLTLRVETAVWPLATLVYRAVTPAPSRVERSVWSAILTEYAKGPHNSVTPLAVNPIAQWPSHERETPSELHHRIVTGWAHKPGVADSVVVVQDFLERNSRPTIMSCDLPRGARYVAHSNLSRHYGENDWWDRFASENGVVAYVSLSRVGLNLAGSRAVIFVEVSCGPVCGHGTYYVLERRGGRWQSVGEYLKWVS